MNENMCQLIFRNCDSPHIENILKSIEENDQRLWDAYRRASKNAENTSDPAIRDAYFETADSLLNAWQCRTQQYYIKTPYACALSYELSLFHSWQNDILTVYKHHYKCPLCAVYYSKYEIGLSYLGMEYTYDGRDYTRAQKSQIPGEEIESCNFGVCQGDDTAYAFNKKRTILHHFGIVQELGRSSQTSAYEKKWNRIWQSSRNAAETIKDLSDFFHFPILFPLFPCETAKLVKDNQKIQWYEITDAGTVQNR